MKVKLLVGRAGVDFSQAAGEVVDMSTDEAQRHVEDGLAELVNAPKSAKQAKPASAAKKPAERAEKRGSGSAGK